MALDKEDIMALIAILQKGLEDDDNSINTETNVKVKPPRKKRTKAQKPSKPNKFDSMPERNLHKADTEIDKKLWANNKPTDRTRQTSLVSVRCRVCGKNEQVSAALVDSAERYKCNKCAAASG